MENPSRLAFFCPQSPHDTLQIPDSSPKGASNTSSLRWAGGAHGLSKCIGLPKVQVWAQEEAT
jgi:hypothetical protein